MNIEAAVAYAKESPFTLGELTLAGPGPDDVLLRMVGSGLCHTDIAARDELLSTYGGPLRAASAARLVLTSRHGTTFSRSDGI
jgi:aryl-alcohol dehydrogenase